MPFENPTEMSVSQQIRSAALDAAMYFHLADGREEATAAEWLGTAALFEAYIRSGN